MSRFRRVTMTHPDPTGPDPREATRPVKSPGKKRRGRGLAASSSTCFYFTVVAADPSIFYLSLRVQYDTENKTSFMGFLANPFIWYSQCKWRHFLLKRLTPA